MTTLNVRSKTKNSGKNRPLTPIHNTFKTVVQCFQNKQLSGVNERKSKTTQQGTALPFLALGTGR